MNKNDRFLIVGLGLLGGSYARGLARAGFAQVYAIDTNPEAIRLPKKRAILRMAQAKILKSWCEWRIG